MLRERNVRTGFFERDQITRIVAHLPTAIRPAVQLAYITGWRIPSEVLPLQWRHVDFEARVVRLDPHTTKNDEGRTFPFTDAIEQHLETAPSSRPTHAETPSRALGARVHQASEHLRDPSAARLPVHGELIRSQHSSESC
jgi:integrase